MEFIKGTDTPLAQAVKERGVTAVAAELGVHHTAVMQMIGKKRDIYLKEIDGLLHYCEFKNWKRGSSNKKAPSA